MVNEPVPVANVPGLSIGHATNERVRTGCTVIRFDRPALTAVEVRGAAPGTRELALLEPGRAVQRVDAIVLAGGSAFGLAAADGVVRALAGDGRGFPTHAGPVPIVPAAVIYDLAEGLPVAPAARDGDAAYRSATPLSDVPQGRVGAGTGATVSKILGPALTVPAGVGIGQRPIGEHLVTAVVVLNAFGVPTGSIEQGTDPRASLVAAMSSDVPHGESTTLIAVVTTMPCDHQALVRACVAAHDALARMVVPAHTMVDGDVAFASTLTEAAISAGEVMRLTMAVELAVETAIEHAAAVVNAGPMGAKTGVPESPISR